MNWIILSSFRLKMTFCRNIQMQLHTNIGDIFLICAYCNESQNGRSSCLDMKMEANNNALWMGLTITWDMQYPAREYEISYQGKMKVCDFLSLSMFSKIS